MKRRRLEGNWRERSKWERRVGNGYVSNYIMFIVYMKQKAFFCLFLDSFNHIVRV